MNNDVSNARKHGDAILVANNIFKHYQQASSKIEVLNGVSLTIHHGDEIAVMGASGSGKSTLLHILGGLDFANQGDVTLYGENFATISEKKRCLLRNQHMGFIYQFHHLLPEFNAMENVAMPLLIRGENREKAHQEALDILQRVGLSKRADHKPSQLSGGERQRAAIARALVTKPACVLADEPTGNLDQATAQAIRELLRELKETLAMGLLVVTHDESMANSMQKRLVVRDGKLI